MTPVSPVVLGLEAEEVVFGSNQPEYMPLPAHRTQDGKVTSRWELTPEERKAIAEGADVFITVHTFNQIAYPPTSARVLRRDVDPDWFRVFYGGVA